MSRTLFLVHVLVLCMLSSVLVAQSVPQSDPQAVVYAAKSIAAMVGTASVNDVTLTANVTWNGIEMGTGTLKALGTGESRIDLAITTGARTEIKDSQTGIAKGQWANPDGTSGLFSYQSCQTDAAWFFPILGSLAAGPNVVLSYVGQQTRNGESVQHIRSYVYQPTLSAGVSTQQFSVVDFYLDAATLLPVATTFNTYPDDGNLLPLPVEIDFSNYQIASGVLLPMQIQRYLQGNLMLDLTISGAAFNTGIPLSTFNVSQRTAHN